MQIKVLSWNIWIEGNFNQTVDFLINSKADIIGLQEVVDNDTNRDIIGVLKNAGYEAFFGSVEHTWGGNVYRDGPALFTRYKMTNNETILLSKKDKRAAVKADITVGDKTLYVFSTHLIHTHQKESEEQNIQVSNLLKKLPTKGTILMGDFNATPQSSVIKNVKKILRDTDPSSTPTWSVYPQGCLACNPQAVDTKLDYIFTTQDINTHAFKVEQSKASDHLPISVLIEV